MIVRIAKCLSVTLFLTACGAQFPLKPKKGRSMDVSLGDLHSVLFSATIEYAEPVPPTAFVMDAAGLLEEVTLTSIYAPATASVTQNFREIIEESFYQESIDSYYDTLNSEFDYSQDFALSQDLEVTVNNANVDRDSLFTEKNIKKVAFKNAPPERALIKMRDHIDVPLPTAFVIDPKAGKTGAQAVVNGVEDSKVEINPRTGELIFAKPPRDGAKIEVSYNKVIEPILSYAFAGVGSDPVVNLVVDVETGEAVDLTVQENRMELAANSHIDGRKVRLRYTDGNLAPNQVLLVNDATAEFVISSKDKNCGNDPDIAINEPKAGKGGKEQLALKEPKAPKGEPQEPKDPNGGIVIADGILTVTCNLSAATEFTVKMTKKPQVRYDVPAMDHIGAWQVTIDGVPTDQFHIEGNTLFIDAELPAAAVIEIEFLT